MGGANHAEQNGRTEEARHGGRREGRRGECTRASGGGGAKMLVNARIKRFVSFGEYSDDAFRELFHEAGVEVEIRERPSDRISFLD